MRERVLGALLALASVLVVVGCAMWSVAVGFVVAGVLLAVQAWLWLGEVNEGRQ